MSFRLSSWAIMPWLLCALYAHAGEREDSSPSPLTDMPLEQLLDMEVQSASRIARQISDAPSAVSIVTADDIKAYGYRTINEITDSMRGLYSSYDRAWHYLGGRGFGRPGDFTGRFMLMIDGYASNDNIYNQLYFDQGGLLDTELIERVEYVPGTGSVAYGNNAYFGIINVVTKNGRDFGGAQVAAEAFSYGGKKGRATFGNQLENGADFLVSASWLDSNGQNLYFPEYDNPAVNPKWASNHGVARGLDYEISKRLFAKLSLDNWSVEGAFVDRKKGVPTGAYGVEFNAYNQYWDTNAFVSAKYDAELNPHLKSSTHAYVGYYLDRGAGYYTDDGMWREYNRGQWWGIDEKFVATWFKDHQLVFGAEFRDDFTFYLSDPVASSKHSRTTTSLYLQDEISLNDEWRVNLGARYDYGKDVHGNISPRVAVMYDPSPQTTVKAAYSTAFRMPAPYEKYYTDGEQIPNPGLDPEYITTTELVLQHRFSRQMNFIGSLYHYRTHDLITNIDTSATTNQYVNVGSTKTTGLELEIERHWDSGIRLRSSYAWQDAKDERGERMINSPRNLAKFNLTFPSFDNWLRTGLEVQYIGSRCTEKDYKLGSYTLTNLTFSSERTYQGVGANLSIRNLFDRDYKAVAPGGFEQDSMQMDGRTLWLQLTYDFWK